jgi:hypothetical protein
MFHRKLRNLKLKLNRAHKHDKSPAMNANKQSVLNAIASDLVGMSKCVQKIATRH